MIAFGRRDNDSSLYSLSDKPSIPRQEFLHRGIVCANRRSFGYNAPRISPTPPSAMCASNITERTCSFVHITQVEEQFHHVDILMISVPELAQLGRLVRIGNCVPEFQLPQLHVQSHVSVNETQNFRVQGK